MPEPACRRAIENLSNLGPLRVWSLLVTVFGDLAPDGPLDGPTLSALMDGIGIKPEATRVAQHRLRGEGWITSQKQGRISQHRLTSKGQQASAAARPRIYGRPEAIGRTIELILVPDSNTTLDPASFAPIAPRLYICAQDTRPPPAAMILSARDIPDWVGAQIETPALQEGYAALNGVLEQIEADMANIDRMDAIDTALLRVMIVHAWRRLALKHPVLPRTAHTAGWRGHDCRALVTELLDRFERPSSDLLKAR